MVLIKRSKLSVHKMRRIYINIAILFFITVFLLSGCRSQDIRRIKINVPEMENDTAAMRVVSILAKVEGVIPESITVDIKERTVTVSYDSIRVALKNLEYALAEEGFTANDIPPMKR